MTGTTQGYHMNTNNDPYDDMENDRLRQRMRINQNKQPTTWPYYLVGAFLLFCFVLPGIN